MNTILTLKALNKPFTITITLDNSRFTGHIDTIGYSGTLSDHLTLVEAFTDVMQFTLKAFKGLCVHDFGKRAVELWNVSYDLKMLHIYDHNFRAYCEQLKLEQDIASVWYELENSSLDINGFRERMSAQYELEWRIARVVNGCE